MYYIEAKRRKNNKNNKNRNIGRKGIIQNPVVAFTNSVDQMFTLTWRRQNEITEIKGIGLQYN